MTSTTNASSTTTSNWKNVNNWHWIEKNAMPWSKTYFTDKLVNTQVTINDTTIKITSLTSFEGDVDVNQRKGKLFAIFDIKIKLKWSATINEKIITGSILIPEVMYDTEPHEIVFEITSDEDSKQAQAVKQTLRSALVPLLRLKFPDFSKDLIASNSADMKIDTNESNGHPALPLYTSKPTIQPSATEKVKEQVKDQDTKNARLVTIKQSIEFVCSAQDMFEVLTIPQKISQWTRAPCTFTPTQDTPFSLYNGNITGTNISIDATKHTIEQSWRLGNWQKDVVSNVKIVMVEGQGGVVLEMCQSGVPESEKESTERNWHQYVWNPIKGTFGYGSSL